MAIVLAGCGNKNVATVPVPAPVAAGSGSQSAPNTSNDGRSPQSGEAQAGVGAIETGEASWYGNPYHGRMAASGEIYDMEELTAAHRTLPFHTWVEVTNLNNGRKVQVRINDRGPFVDGRIIDLSRAAAREIDMLRAGVVPVELRIIGAPDTNLASIDLPERDLPAGSAPQQEPGNDPAETASAPNTRSEGYVVQAGAFALRDGAVRVRDRIASRLPDANARIVARDIAAGDGDQAILWRVLVGEGLSRPQAAELAEEISTISGEALVTSE